MVGIEASLESARNVYRALGVVALLSAAIYLALYHLLLAPRCASPVQHPPNNLLQGIMQFLYISFGKYYQCLEQLFLCLNVGLFVSFHFLVED